MLEHETQIIIQTLTERALGSAQSVALKDVLTADLPRSIKAYIRSDVMRWLHTDLRSASHFSNIRFAAPLVQHLTKMYTRSLASEYVFTREEFTSTLENATHFVENYLCRPQWTLEQFMFEKTERVTPFEVQNRFEYISDYPYYSKLIQGYLNLKGLREINREDFRSLLARIDDRVVNQHTPKELALLTHPIYEFLLLQPEIAGSPIPIKPLIIFYEDKKLTTVRDYVERICRIRNTDHLTIEQLGNIIEDLYSEPDKPLNEMSVQQPAQPEQYGSDSMVAAEPDMQANPSALTDEPQSQSHRDAGDAWESEPEPAIPLKEEVHPPPNSDAAPDRRNIALSLTYSGMQATPPAASPPLRTNLNGSIADDQRRRFIRTIFQNDEAYYNVVIEAINGMATWKDASLYLQMFYQATGLDPFARDVVEFTDIIQQRYSSTPSP